MRARPQSTVVEAEIVRQRQARLEAEVRRRMEYVEKYSSVMERGRQ